MNTLYITIGISGSGKSTFCNKLKKIEGKTLKIVSTDGIRKELFNDETEQKQNGLVFKTAYNRIVKHLTQGYDVAFDATNLRISTLKDIDKLLTNNGLKKHLKVIGLVFDTSLNLDYCLKNNNNRNRVVPVDVIKKQQKLFINNICEIVNNKLFTEIKNICWQK